MKNFKVCTKCNEPRALSEFSLRHKQGKPRTMCKICSKIYNTAYFKSAVGKKNAKKSYLKHKDKIRASRRRYFETAAGKRVRESEIKRGLSAAGLAVGQALKKGIIFRKKICASCFKENIRTHFHHLKGYAKANYLNVVELCVSCHKEAHAEPDHQFHPRTDQCPSTNMAARIALRSLR